MMKSFPAPSYLGLEMRVVVVRSRKWEMFQLLDKSSGEDEKKEAERECSLIQGTHRICARSRSIGQWSGFCENSLRLESEGDPLVAILYACALRRAM